jgi:hypothetical protein
MTGNEDAVDAKINPSGGKVWKWDPPFFFLIIDMRLERELIDSITLPKISLVILTVMLECDLRVQLKERREETVRTPHQ